MIGKGLKAAITSVPALLGAIALFSAASSYAGPSRGNGYRVGWEEDPPFQTRAPNGAPTGYVVELVSEAARRRGIRLEWVFSPQSSEKALREGSVDVWPLMTIREERKKFVHFSDPYMQHDHYLITRAGGPFSQLQDLSRATVAHLNVPIASRLLAGILPNARLRAEPTTKDAVNDVCAGRADAAFTDEFTALATLFSGVSCADQPLSAISIPALRSQLAVASSFAYAAVADQIREEIGVMAADGEIIRLMNRWGYNLPRNLETTSALLKAGKVERRLSYTAAFFVVLSLVALVVANHIRRQRNQIKREIKEREEVQGTLRESERRFRDLLEHAQLLAIIIDLKKGISFCNSYALSITGWTREEMIGRPAARFVDANYLHQLEEAMQASSAADAPLPLSEAAILSKDGQRRWIQWTSTVLRDSAGTAIGFASLGEDVTELRRLRDEAAIRESEERFRAIFQGAPVGVAQVDLDGRITLANDRYCSILGTTRDSLFGESFQRNTHPDDLGPQLNQLSRLQSGEFPSFSMEKRYIHEDGANLWARVHVSVIRDHENQAQHFIVVLEDITERKQAEAALRESEERLRLMADTVPVLIWVAGPNKECTFCNKGWLNFTGRTLEQELNDGWVEGVHPEDRERAMATYHSAFDRREAFQMEYRLRSADGSYRWVRDDGVPRFDTDGAFVGYIGSCTDVTSNKRAHEEALARQKLESVGVLAGGIAHDFNNLLGSIMADSELVLSELDGNSAAREGILRINAVSLRAAEIVRELLAYAGKENPVFEPVDTTALVREMIQLLKVSVSKCAVLRVHLPHNLPRVRANAAQIRQVVLNLITNASESLGEEGGVISVTARRTLLSRDSAAELDSRLAPGDYLRLEVTDTGCGMTEETKAKMFDPFFTTKFAGRGLGLAAVQGIMRGHGGGIHVESKAGQGTRFQIFLPLLDEAARPEAHCHAPSNGSTATTKGTILFVEDEESLRAPVSKMLRKSGYTIIEAANGDSAIELFEMHQEEIDVVLLDMTLPGLSGPDIFSEMHVIQPDVNVVFTTAYSHDTLVTALGGQRAFGFVRKPYHFADLLNALRDATHIGASSQA